MKYFLPLFICLFSLQSMVYAQEISKKAPVVAEEALTKKDTVPPDQKKMEPVVTHKPKAFGTPVMMDTPEETIDEKIDNGSGYYKVKINDKAHYTLKRTSSDTDVYGLVKDGRQVLPTIFTRSFDGYNSGIKGILEIMRLGRQYGVFDPESEKWIVPLQYDHIQNFNQTTYTVKKGDYYGVLDVNNTVIVPLEWNSLYKVNETDNYAIVSKNEKYGLLNIISNKLTIPCIYRELSILENSLNFKVKKDDTFNIVNANNKPLFKEWYQEINIPSKKRKNYIVKLNDRMGIIDENERLIAPIDYIYINTSPFRDGSYLAKNKNNKYGCLTLDGTITLPFEYDFLSNILSSSIIATKNRKCGLIQVNDGVPYMITSCDFDNIQPTRNVFVVEKNKKFGLLDLYGKVISPVDFDKIELSKSEKGYYGIVVFIATKDKFQFLINEKGESLNSTKCNQIVPLYSYPNPDSYYSRKKSDYFIFSINGKTGLMDIYGKEVVPNLYEDIIALTQDNHLIIKQNGKSGIYNLFGKKMLLEPTFDNIFEEKGKMYGQLDNSFYLLALDKTGKFVAQKL